MSEREPIVTAKMVERGLDAMWKVPSSGFMGGNLEEKMRIGLTTALKCWADGEAGEVAYDGRSFVVEGRTAHGAVKRSPYTCRKPAATFIPREGMSWACVLPREHTGPCKQGGECFTHGCYIGSRCPECELPTP